MKFANTGCLSRKAATLACAVALIVNAASPAANSVGEEPAVWQAMAEFIAHDNASHPYKLLYFQSDFENGSLATNSMADPIRREFKDLCGLSASEARAMVSQLQAINAESVIFDQAVAEPAGMKLGKKKSPRARYVALSRVVFDPTNQHAWLAVDLGGVSGAIMRMDKVAGQWSKTARCGGWMKSE
jgi:hypothetical protein